MYRVPNIKKKERSEFNPRSVGYFLGSGGIAQYKMNHYILGPGWPLSKIYIAKYDQLKQHLYNVREILCIVNITYAHHGECGTVYVCERGCCDKKGSKIRVRWRQLWNILVFQGYCKCKTQNKKQKTFTCVKAVPSRQVIPSSLSLKLNLKHRHY